MDTEPDYWAEQYDKQQEIHEKRLKNKEHQQRENKCCSDEEVKIIQTHGSMSNYTFSLPHGYNVIFMAEFGKAVCGSLRNFSKLKELYANGHTLFKDSDTTPKYTDEGYQWIINLGFDMERQTTSPTLFVGGEPNKISDIDGKVYAINPSVPDVDFTFSGHNCNNWNKEGQSNKPINYSNFDYTCYIACVGEGSNPHDEENRCDRYYENNIKLSQILQNEGPGTYIVYSCLASYLSEDMLKYFNDYLNYQQFILKQSGIARTRSQHKDLIDKLTFLQEYSSSYPSKTLDSFDYDMEEASFGKKTKKSKTKTKKTKKTKTKKTKKTKSKTKKTKKTKTKKTKSKTKKTKSKSKKNLKLKRLQKKAKKLKIRITKIVRGKRRYKTVKELRKQLNKNKILK